MASARPAKKARTESDVGSPTKGELAFEPVPLHFKVPHGIFIHEATSVAVDSKVHVLIARLSQYTLGLAHTVLSRVGKGQLLLL